MGVVHLVYFLIKQQQRGGSSKSLYISACGSIAGIANSSKNKTTPNTKLSSRNKKEANQVLTEQQGDSQGEESR